MLESLLVMLGGPGESRSSRTASFLAAASYSAPLERYWPECLDKEEREGEVWWCSAVWDRAGFRLPGTGVRPLDLCSWTSLPTSTRLERDLARWMLSTVGGVMCFPPLTLCFVNNFLWPCGDLQTIGCFWHSVMFSHASRHLSADYFATCQE